jgi:acetyl-CoA C-acetyltransferase/acetyl-CoA acyltransferase
MHPEIMQEQSGIAGVLADYLDLKKIRVMRIEMGEASGLAAITAAFGMIRSGLSKSVMVLGVEKVTEYPTSMITRAYSLIEDSEYKGFYGVTPAVEAAILAKMYMRRYRVRYQDLYRWPYLMHIAASQNPYAQLRFRLKENSYQRSPIISDPLRLVDIFPYGDGAACTLIADRSVVGGGAIVSIEGLGSSSDVVDPFSRNDPLYFGAVKESFDQAISMAKINRNQIKYIELHDSFTPYACIVIEYMGLVEKGTCTRNLADDLSVNGTYINLSGGLKARGHPWGATGIYQVLEIYKALLGEDPFSRAGEITYAAAQNMNGAGSQSYTAILKRVD